MLQLVTSEDLVLLEDLERIHLLCVFLLDKEHLTVASLANDLDLFEITDTNAISGGVSIAHLLHLVDRFLMHFFLHSERAIYTRVSKHRMSFRTKEYHCYSVRDKS